MMLSKLVPKRVMTILNWSKENVWPCFQEFSTTSQPNLVNTSTMEVSIRVESIEDPNLWFLQIKCI